MVPRGFFGGRHSGFFENGRTAITSQGMSSRAAMRAKGQSPTPGCGHARGRSHQGNPPCFAGARDDCTGLGRLGARGGRDRALWGGQEYPDAHADRLVAGWGRADRICGARGEQDHRTGLRADGDRLRPAWPTVNWCAGSIRKPAWVRKRPICCRQSPARRVWATGWTRNTPSARASQKVHRAVMA